MNVLPSTAPLRDAISKLSKARGCFYDIPDDAYEYLVEALELLRMDCGMDISPDGSENKEEVAR